MEIKRRHEERIFRGIFLVVIQQAICTTTSFYYLDKNYSLRQKQLGHFSQTLFFPFSCSPRPSQSCLSRFGHQILYTNIEGTRRTQSVPTILTETVFQRNFRYVTPSWLQWREIARQVYARFGAIFPGKTLEILRIERGKTINRGKKSLFLQLQHSEVLKKAFYVLG